PRGAADPRLGHRRRQRRDPHHRHARRPAAGQAARSFRQGHARGDPHSPLARLHGGPGFAARGSQWQTARSGESESLMHVETDSRTRDLFCQLFASFIVPAILVLGWMGRHPATDSPGPEIVRGPLEGSWEITAVLRNGEPDRAQVGAVMEFTDYKLRFY